MNDLKWIHVIKTLGDTQMIPCDELIRFRDIKRIVKNEDGSIYIFSSKSKYTVDTKHHDLILKLFDNI